MSCVLLVKSLLVSRSSCFLCEFNSPSVVLIASTLSLGLPAIPLVSCTSGSNRLVISGTPTSTSTHIPACTAFIDAAAKLAGIQGPHGMHCYTTGHSTSAAYQTGTSSSTCNTIRAFFNARIPGLFGPCYLKVVLVQSGCRSSLRQELHSYMNAAIGAADGCDWQCYLDRYPDLTRVRHTPPLHVAKMWRTTIFTRSLDAGCA